MKERIRETMGAITDGARIAWWNLAEASKAMSPVSLTPDQEKDFQRGKSEAELQVSANRIVRRAARGK